MNISRLSDEILEVHVPSTEYKIIWVSDLHYDSKYSQSDKLIKFLNDHPTHYVIIGGDGLDVMQFVNDRRGSKSDVKSEYNHTDYANRIIDDVRNKLILPFKDRIICWIRGNHDNSVIKHHNIDLLGLICGVDVHVHEFNGYIVLKNKIYEDRGNSRNIIHFSHAPEAGGTRSKGSLSIDLAKAEYPDADIWVREHIHNGFIHPVTTEHIKTGESILVTKNKWYIQNVAAKQESQGKRNGFHYETMKGRRSSGILELSFRTDRLNTYCDRVNHIIF